MVITHEIVKPNRYTFHKIVIKDSTCLGLTVAIQNKLFTFTQYPDWLLYTYTYIFCVLSVYLSLLFCSYFVVLFFLMLCSCFDVLCTFFVCTSVGLLPPEENPIAVSNNNNNNNLYLTCHITLHRFHCS